MKQKDWSDVFVENYARRPPMSLDDFLSYISDDLQRLNAHTESVVVSGDLSRALVSFRIPKSRDNGVHSITRHESETREQFLARAFNTIADLRVNHIDHIFFSESFDSVVVRYQPFAPCSTLDSE